MFVGYEDYSIRAWDVLKVGFLNLLPNPLMLVGMHFSCSLCTGLLPYSVAAPSGQSQPRAHVS